MTIDFEWDPRKAESNVTKHRVSFAEATTIFRDPRVASFVDEEHGEHEERWVTMGTSSRGRVLVVCHAFSAERADAIRIRIISARRATRPERAQYDG